MEKIVVSSKSMTEVCIWLLITCGMLRRILIRCTTQLAGWQWAIGTDKHCTRWLPMLRISSTPAMITVAQWIVRDQNITITMLSWLVDLVIQCQLSTVTNTTMTRLLTLRRPWYFPTSSRHGSMTKCFAGQWYQQTQCPQNHQHDMPIKLLDEDLDQAEHRMDVPLSTELFNIVPAAANDRIVLLTLMWAMFRYL